MTEYKNVVIIVFNAKIQTCIFIFFSDKLSNLTVRAITRGTPHDLAAKRRFIFSCFAVF